MKLNLLFDCDLSFLLQTHSSINKITKKYSHKHVSTIANNDFKTYERQQSN